MSVDYVKVKYRGTMCVCRLCEGNRERDSVCVNYVKGRESDIVYACSLSQGKR